MKILLIIVALSMAAAGALHWRGEQSSKTREEYVLIIEEPVWFEDAATTQDITIHLKTADGTIDVPMETYLLNVVMTEMPASFSLEALKAQAVAARTFAVKIASSDKHPDADVCTNPACCQAWCSEAELRKKYGTAYDASYEKAAAAVRDTADEVLLYDNALIEAVYYSCSGGTSEAAAAVWGSEVPYLQSVSSPGEEIASKYESTVRISFQRFKEMLRNANASVAFSVIPENWIGKTSYTDGGGVATMELGGIDFSGTKLRNIFSLNSTLFDLSVGNGEMIFSVKGYGHRVGMSQYGAEVMAAAGKTYEEILRHYYTGVSIKKLSRTGSGQFVFSET